MNIFSYCSQWSCCERSSPVTLERVRDDSISVSGNKNPDPRSMSVSWQQNNHIEHVENVFGYNFGSSTNAEDRFSISQMPGVPSGDSQLAKAEPSISQMSEARSEEFDLNDQKASRVSFSVSQTASKLETPDVQSPNTSGWKARCIDLLRC